MEFKVNEYQLPEQLTFNYDELKQELTEKVEMYKTLVYTEEQIKEAKSDRASLNKLKSALNDERIRREKEYMQPFNEFKSKVAEIIKIIDEPIAMIDTQVKGYEEKKKEEKREKIIELFDSLDKPEWLKLEQLFQDKFLNASCSMKNVEQYFLDGIKEVNRNLETLSSLPEFGFEATEVYKSSLDINRAISEAQRMSQIAKAKAEREAQLKAQEEAKKAEEFAKAMNPPVEPQPVEEPRQQATHKKNWVKFAAFLTGDEALELKRFFDDRAIDFKAI